MFNELIGCAYDSMRGLYISVSCSYLQLIQNKCISEGGEVRAECSVDGSQPSDAKCDNMFSFLE